jgi:hypothetical protein
MKLHEITTSDFIKLIGSPFTSENPQLRSDKHLEQIYEKAFYERVAPLYLHKFKYEGWSDNLEERFQFIQNREEMTLNVLADLSANLNKWDENGYVIFKSIKPYPAIPNDTDILIFGGKKEFESALAHLYSCGYIFHEWAPMQTTLYDPRGKGKIGKGKKGGIYYIDVYRDISTDYVCYLDERSLRPYVAVKEINSIPVRLLRPEPELAIILFHNLFPERTFQLEHFYMPLYSFADINFDLDLFISFAEKNRLTYAIKTNLSLVAKLHETHFGFVPGSVEKLLNRWKWNQKEVHLFEAQKMGTPYLFSPRAFWTSVLKKIRDQVFLKSLVVQALHMLNPAFFADVMISLKRRFSEKGVYHME